MLSNMKNKEKRNLKPELLCGTYVRPPIDNLNDQNEEFYVVNLLSKF